MTAEIHPYCGATDKMFACTRLRGHQGDHDATWGGLSLHRWPNVEDPRIQVVVDFLDAWRYCPLATSPNPSRQCLEDTARQLLDALGTGA